jgi:hypothetical protein
MPRKPAAAPDYTTPPEDPVVSAMRARRHDPDMEGSPLDRIYKELYLAGRDADPTVHALAARVVAPPPSSESPPKAPSGKHTPEKIARVLEMLSGGQHTNVVAMACGLSAAAVRGIWRRHGGKRGSVT